LTWTRGWIGGAAVLTIAPDGVLSLEGVDNKGLAGALLNEGRVVWSGGGQIWQNAGEFRNQLTGIFDLQTDAALLVTGGAPTNHNTGRILKSSGLGATFLGVPLANTGTLEAQTGAISYAAGSIFSAGSSFTGGGTNLLAAGGVMTLEGEIHSENLELGGAATVLAGASTIHGTLSWTRGWIGGAATVTIAPDGGLSLAGVDNKGLAGTLLNEGRVVWSGGGQIWQNAGEIHNQLTGTFEVQTDAAVLLVGGMPTNHNAGRILKSSGLGATFLGVPLENTGTLEVQTGVISYAAGSVFSAGSSFTGAGINLLAAGGVMTLEGAIQSGNLELGGSATVVAGTSTIQGTWTWSSGWIGGGAVVTVATNSTLRLIGPADKGLAGTLDNLGRVTWSDSGQIAMGGGALNNLAGGLFEIQNDRAIYYYTASLGRVHNAGLFRKSGGSGVTSLSAIPFENSGTVDVQTGLLLFAGPYTQAGGRLNLGLNSLTDFGRIQFTGTAPLTGTLAVNLNGAFRPRAGDAFTVVTYPARAGAFTGFDLPPAAAWQSDDTVYRASGVTLTVLNARPVLGAVEDWRLDEETPLIVALSVDHPDPGQTVTYGLTEAPPGLQIDSVAGVVSWTPGEAQGPSTNAITVRATDNGTPPLSDTRTFTVIVREVNLPPRWTGPVSRTNNELTLLEIPDLATDPDLPANTLSYALLSGPAGAAVDPHSGRLWWTPTEAQGPGHHLLSVRVSDDGEPSWSITNQLAVAVLEVNSAPVLTTPGAQTLDELALGNVTNTVRDTDLPTNALAFSLLSAPAGAQIHPATGVLTWTPSEAQGPTNATIRVRVIDDGTPPLSATQAIEITVREVNLPPALAVIPDQTVLEGFSLAWTNVADDPDLPANTLTFSLVAPPAGFAIDPARGILTWTPAPDQVPGTNRITVRVTDDGTPTGTHERTFTAIVVPVPSLHVAADGERVTIHWSGAAPGFVLQTAATLGPPIEWQDATNVVGQAGDERVVTNQVANGPRYFRLRRP
jgi:hypothetical protein